MAAPPLYFPVSPTPLAMTAGLLKFPSETEPFFLVDDQRSALLAVKRDERPEVRARRCGNAVETAEEGRAEAAVLAWMDETAAREAPEVLADVDADVATGRPRWDAYGRALQEDFAILHRGHEGRGRAIVLHVSGPSGWRPEHLVGADFAAIHVPVPGFPGRAGDSDERRDVAAKSMVASMIDRGPYVRYVWTVSVDAHFDHHPDSGLRARWTPDCAQAKELYFRVERQTTIPFSNDNASLFLIRTFVYPFSRLSDDQRELLATALAAMPPEIAAYKGLSDAVVPAVAHLRSPR